MTSRSRMHEPASDDAQRARFEARLYAERDVLANRLHDGQSLASPPESHEQPAESALDDVARDLEFHSREATTSRLALVESALVRLRDGGFGLCQACGEPISERRLEHDAAVALCIDCQAALETPHRNATL